MMSRNKFLFILFGALILLGASFASSTVYAQWSTDLAQPTHDKLGEYYYWDGDNLVGTAGLYNKNLVWHSSGSSGSQGEPFRANDDISLVPNTVKEGNSTCDSLPTNQGSDNYLEIRVNTQGAGNGVLDVTGDGSSSSWQDEDGQIKWGGHKTNGWNVAGTIANSATNRRECEFDLYTGFNKNLVPYAKGYLEKGVPYAGKILGQKGTPFKDWVDHSDNRNIYMAYKQSAGDNIMDHCNDQADKNACNNDLQASFRRCYAQAVGAQESELDENNINSPAWKNKFNPESFLSCTNDDKTTDKYFNGDKEDFFKKILDDADIPASIKPKTPDAVDASQVDEKTHCAIDRIGWILCPTLNFVAKMTDKLFDVLKNWLVVAPISAEATTSQASMAYQAWQMMRNVANVIFVIGFIVMIYSYLTGAGLTRYAMNKMIPRLVITAILVNASFILCAVAIDVSNVLGDSLFRVIHDFEIKQADSSKYSSWEWITTSVVLAGGAAAGLVATIASLAALVPMLITALIALVFTFFALILRQAIIIILVVVAPIAFALYLLPNTSKWFDRWKGMFMNMLMLYPAIAVVFAGSYFASQVVYNSAKDSGEVLLAIFALGIQVIPLFIAPVVMKLGGGILNRFGGIINNPNKGPFDLAKRKAEQFRDDRKTLQQTRALNGAGGTFGVTGKIQRRNARRTAAHNYHKTNREREHATAFGSDKNAEAIARMAAGRSGSDELKNLIKDNLQEQARKLSKGELQAAGVVVDQQISSGNDENIMNKLHEQAMTGKDESGAALSDAQRSAAIQRVVSNGNIEQIHQLINNSNQLSQNQRENLANTIKSSGVGSRAAHLADDGALSSIRSGNANVNDMYANAARGGAYTPAAMAMQSPESIDGMAGALTPEQIAAVKRSFNEAAANPKLSQSITSGTRNAVGRL